MRAIGQLLHHNHHNLRLRGLQLHLRRQFVEPERRVMHGAVRLLDPGRVVQRRGYHHDLLRLKGGKEDVLKPSGGQKPIMRAESS